jgi:hypothetical protein
VAELSVHYSYRGGREQSFSSQWPGRQVSQVGRRLRLRNRAPADATASHTADLGIGATREVELLAILAVLDAPTEVADLTDVKVAGSASYHDVDETNVVMPSNDRLALRPHVPHSDGFSGSMISKL